VPVPEGVGLLDVEIGKPVLVDLPDQGKRPISLKGLKSLLLYSS
jgi:hypothetical protein